MDNSKSGDGHFSKCTDLITRNNKFKPCVTFHRSLRLCQCKRQMQGLMKKIVKTQNNSDSILLKSIEDFGFGSPYRHRIQFTIYSKLHKNDLKKRTELFTIAGRHSSSSNHKQLCQYVYKGQNFISSQNDVCDIQTSLCDMRISRDSLLTSIKWNRLILQFKIRMFRSVKCYTLEFSQL